jgi:hypothetical protein
MNSGQKPSQIRRGKRAPFPSWEKEAIARIIGDCSTITEQSLQHVVEVLTKMTGGPKETPVTPAKSPRVATEKAEKPAEAEQQAKQPVSRVWDRDDLDGLPAAEWLRENNTKETRGTPEGKSHLGDLSAAIALLTRTKYLVPSDRYLPKPDAFWRRIERTYRSDEDSITPYGQIIPKGCDQTAESDFLEVIFPKGTATAGESTKKKSAKRARTGTSSEQRSELETSSSLDID